MCPQRRETKSSIDPPEAEALTYTLCTHVINLLDLDCRSVNVGNNEKDLAIKTCK